MRNRGDRPRGQSCNRSREENLAMVMMRMAVTRDRARLISIAALAAATGMFAEAAEATTLAAWVQLVGRDGAASIRAMTDGATCPSLSVDGTAVRMRVRAEPGPLFADASSLPHADFPIRVCEAAAEPKTKVVLDGKDLPVLRGDIRRIVVFGDTGCRIKNKKVQDCNNADEWPYATLAQHAAAAKPDVVIHVGDHLYRETPCSPQVKHCPNSPTGYGWKTWNADFFTPSQPLFAAAPWVMLRGNHEVCDRAGEGWFRFLDHARMSPNCLAMSDFFVVTAGTFGFAVADSALVAGADNDDDDDDGDTGVSPEQAVALTAALRHNYNAIAAAIPPNAWFLSHVSFNAVRLKSGHTVVDDKVQQGALGQLLPSGIQMIVSGHIHMFEALGFADGTPPQIVVGTGGTKLAKQPDDHPKEVNGAKVASAFITKQFGYMLWERDEQDVTKWSGVLFDEGGAPIGKCGLQGRKLACQGT
jgi:hypothetical protein